MTKKDKIKKKFLENPKSLNFSKILNFLLSEWYEFQEAKGSHKKIEYLETWENFVVAVHNNEIKDIYKVLLKEFYISNLEKNEN